ncbi:tetratricopeptide repeat protein [Roseovarius ramblicola]|uniref:Tetratricopeptide repeat protein n=1 Tax=Roseovarius ramblicola TaxID=2022336 RepID=A0ABV5I2Y5_9RHOB
MRSVTMWSRGYGAIMAGLAALWGGPGSSATASDAAAACHEIAGAPEAGAPVSRAAMTGRFQTLGRARPHCEAAVIGPDPDPAALFHLAVIMQREGVHERARALFAMAAGAGVAAAHTKLGDYYNFGIGPVREDHARAVERYRRAAEAGDAPAQATLAIMYRLGRGVPRDFDRMIALLTESAGAGYHVAQVRLADLHMSARGVPRRLAEEHGLPDPVKAAELYRKAADQGSAEAEAALTKLIEGGADAFDDPATRVAWLRHAAAQGDARAINALGFLHERGEGVDYNPGRAAKLYVEALETGDLPVEDLRGQIGGRWVRWDRDTALAFQTILRERGLYRGALDAQVGPGTLSAARRLTRP